jgi:hypothetical protein
LPHAVAVLVNHSHERVIRALSCFDLGVKRPPQIGDL